MNCNQSQEAAIRHTDGPALVLAGPGSGKTTVITHRVRHLIEEHGVRPDNILVITFTKAAALEMKERFNTLTDHTYLSVSFGTFHACFFNILRYAYNYSAEHILKESDGIRLLSSVLAAIGSDLSEDPELVNSLMQEFMLYKGNYSFLPEEERNAYLPQSCDRKTFFRAFTKYEEELRRVGKVDFEDMLSMTYELLSERPDILRYWQNRFRYLLIDEFQDINLLQYRIVQMLADPRNNLFIVGDEDQSIYGFRGSRPEIMLRFPKDYPDAKQILLNMNYRSSAAILSAAGKLISVNKSRYAKELVAASPEGPAPVYCTFSSTEEELDRVISQIRELLISGVTPNEIAILYRTNLQPRRLTEKLRLAEVPYALRGFLPCLYDNIYLKPVLAYLRIATQKPSRDAVLLVSNKPTRYLSRNVFTDAEVDFDKVKQYYRDEGKDYVCDKIDRLQYDLRMMSRMTPFAAIHYVRKVIGYDGYIRETLKDPDTVMELLEELLEDAKAFTSITQYLEHTTEVLAEHKRAESERRTPKEDTTTESSIQLMTFHSSKGLEFTYVFLIDCNETLIPHKKALLPENIEEERRLLYVAMTRAKQGLFLYSVEKRFGRALPVSRFIGEIQLSRQELNPDTRVIHKQFGAGRILSVNEKTVTIQFERFTLPKTLSLSFCQENRLIEITD